MIVFSPGREGLLLCWHFKTAVSERMKKMWKRQEFQEEKENTVCEEIKRAKKMKLQNRERNVTITGRNVQLWNKFTELILLHWINGWIGWTVSGSSSGSPPPWTLAHTELAERYIQGQVECCTGHSASVDLTAAQAKTSVRQAWELGVREAVLAGIIFGVLLEDAETASEARMLKLFPPVAAEGLKATVVWPVLESVVIKSPLGLLTAAQDYPLYSESCL